MKSRMMSSMKGRVSITVDSNALVDHTVVSLENNGYQLKGSVQCRPRWIIFGPLIYTMEFVLYPKLEVLERWRDQAALQDRFELAREYQNIIDKRLRYER